MVTAVQRATASTNSNNVARSSQADSQTLEKWHAAVASARQNQPQTANQPSNQTGSAGSPHKDTVSDPAKRLSTYLSIAADTAKAEGRTFAQGMTGITGDTIGVFSKVAKVAQGDPMAITSVAAKGISAVAYASKSANAVLKGTRTALDSFFEAHPLISKVATKLGFDVKSLSTPWRMEADAAKIDAAGGLLSKVTGQVASWATTAGKTPIETAANIVNNSRDALKTIEAGGKVQKTFGLVKGVAQDALKLGEDLVEGDSLVSKVAKGAANLLNKAAGAAADMKIAGKFFGAARILGPVAVAASAIPDAIEAAKAFSKGDIKGGATSALSAGLTVGAGALMFTPAAPVAIGVAAVDLGLGLVGDRLGIGHQSIEERVAGAAVDLATKVPSVVNAVGNFFAHI